jgi:hypothetical protein
MNSWKPFKLSVLVIRHTMTFQGEEGVSAFLTKSNVTTILTRLHLYVGWGRWAALIRTNPPSIN